jgi:RNA polymerase sigma-70 factor (ECF subfamily)
VIRGTLQERCRAETGAPGQIDPSSTWRWPARAGLSPGRAELVRYIWTTSARTENKSQIRQLRERLPQADQALLILRINRRLGWTEIARILGDEGEASDAATLAREAARLRKRYQTAKEKLRRLAEAEGLVEPR